MNTKSPFLLPLLLLLLAVSGEARRHKTSTLQVFHISATHANHPQSWADTVLQMQSHDDNRLHFLSSLVARRSDVPIASARQLIQSPSYVVRARIGTPAQTLLMALDTSNDAAWIPCSGCVGCPGTTVFSSDKSSSFRPLPCHSSQCSQVPNPSCGATACAFNMTYGGSTVAADLVQDNITLARDSIPTYTFGCVTKATGSSVPPQGLLGLGRGPLSLLSQTQSLYRSTFSYCLPSFKSGNFAGSLRLGPVAQPKRIKYTPLLRNPRRSSLYYVNLVAIRVGSRIVDIPPSAFAFNAVTGSGTIIDSGTTFTRLVTPAYEAVRNEFRRRIGNATISTLGGFDTCYTVPIISPTITFMFAGMNVTLPPDNFLIHSTAGSTTCLAIAAAPDNVNSVLNVIANMQQQNHRIVFDLPNSRLGVSREPCS